MKKTAILFFLIILGSFTSCHDDSKQDPIDTKPIAFQKEAELLLYNASGEKIKQLDIEIADDAYQRETGLMYRKSLEQNQGMLFIFPGAAPRAFYMKNTYIPLDIIYFDQDSTAISFQENAKPLDETSLPSDGPAQFVLEINAGLVKQWKIQKGDKMQFELQN